MRSGLTKIAQAVHAVPLRYVVAAALVKPGRNVVAVRVLDHYGDGGLTGEARQLYLAPSE